MRKFSTSEIKVIVGIFTTLIVVITLNIQVSLRKGRDATRKNDLGSLQKNVDNYYNRYHSIPESTVDGMIIGCFNEDPKVDKITGVPTNTVPCEWGKSSFQDIKIMPNDPDSSKGVSYKYVTDGQKYMVYISLEGKKEAEYTESVVALNLQCGTRICNYGRGN